jgi:acyl carrier protein
VATDEIEARVAGVIADLFGLDPGAVGPDTSPDTIEAWDSLQHLNLVLALEEEFGFQMTDDETVAAVSFPLITLIVREKLGLAETG